MKKGLKTPHFHPTFLLLTLTILGISSPSLFSQKLISVNSFTAKVSLLKIGSGLYQPYTDGRKGVNFGMAYEKAFSRRMSWLVNTDLLFHPADDRVLLRGILRPTVQSRFAVHPELRYYTQRVLQRFHIGLVGGFIGGYGKGTGVINPDGSAVLRSFTEEWVELKAGWQQPFRKDFVWNIFGGLGCWIPNESGAESGLIPVFRIGLLVGTR
jgi:hypothetical protein